MSGELSTTSSSLGNMWKTMPCFGKLTSQPSLSHAKMTPMLPSIVSRTKLPTCTDHLQRCRIVVGILNDAIIEPLNQCLMGIDAYHDCQMPVASYQITYFHMTTFKNCERIVSRTPSVQWTTNQSPVVLPVGILFGSCLTNKPTRPGSDGHERSTKSPTCIYHLQVLRLKGAHTIVAGHHDAIQSRYFEVFDNDARATTPRQSPY